MQPVTDMRSYLERLEGMGEIKHIEGADLDTEVGALTEYMGDVESQALLFDGVCGFSQGLSHRLQPVPHLRALGGGHGLADGRQGSDFLHAWRKRSLEFQPLPYEQVEGGPVFENQMEEGDVDLTRFPTPLWHDLDGGRYIGTGCGVITKDPESGGINIGTYRVMIQEKNKVSVKMNKGKHGRLAMERAHARGESLPVAITLGQEPAVMLSSQMPLPPSVNEYEFAGWMQGRPIPVVRGAVTGLPIPPTARWCWKARSRRCRRSSCPRRARSASGRGTTPTPPRATSPLMTVKRVYYRDDPIILGAPPVKPPNSYLPIPLGAITLWEQLEKAGIPDVTGVWGFVYGGQTGPFTVISIKQRYTGHAKQTLLVAAGCRAGAYGGKMVVVVDDDVDITNAGEVIWAISTRCDPREGIDIVKNVWASVCEPVISPRDRETKGYVTDRVLIDACRPYHWIDQFPPVNAFKQDYKETVAKKWGV